LFILTDDGGDAEENANGEKGLMLSFFVDCKTAVFINKMSVEWNADPTII